MKKQLESEGWKVLRNGAPDFIALKVVNGSIIDMKGVEVKRKGSSLTYEQEIYRKVFVKAGVSFEVLVVD